MSKGVGCETMDTGANLGENECDRVILLFTMFLYCFNIKMIVFEWATGIWMGMGMGMY